MGLAARLGAVAAKHFAIDDRRPQRLLGLVVGGGQVRLEQKRKPSVAIVVQVAGENVVDFVATRPRRQVVHAIDVFLIHGHEVLLGTLASVIRIAELQSFLHQVDNLPREDLGPANMVFFQVMGAPQRMTHAQLMNRVLETIVGGGAIADQGAGVVKADDFLQSICTAARVDDITGGLVTDPGVEPDESSAFSPARFIGSDERGVLDRLFDFLVNGLQLVSGPKYDACRRAGLDVDAVGLLEVVGDLAVGHAGAFVEIDDAGLGVRPDLALGGADGVGGLQRMAAAHASPAVLAAAFVDAELSADRLGGNVDLKLFVDVVILGDVASAMGTSVGQRRFKRFVDGFGRRRAMTVLAVLGASFASRLFRRRRGIPFGEGGGLTLAGAFLVVESLFEFGDPFLEFVDLAIALAAPRA